jgi:hypothetical protein
MIFDGFVKSPDAALRLVYALEARRRDLTTE